MLPYDPPKQPFLSHSILLKTRQREDQIWTKTECSYLMRGHEKNSKGSNWLSNGGPSPSKPELRYRPGCGEASLGAQPVHVGFAGRKDFLIGRRVVQMLERRPKELSHLFWGLLEWAAFDLRDRLQGRKEARPSQGLPVQESSDSFCLGGNGIGPLWSQVLTIMPQTGAQSSRSTSWLTVGGSLLLPFVRDPT